MSPTLSSGATWHRWDPHLHAPGTLHNDQFGGGDAWEKYLQAIETASPAIRALGVADYYLTEGYERIVEARSQGRLSGVDLIFPNVECRLNVGTVKGRWVNIHLLVSPEEPDHLQELARFMARLRFSAHDDAFACTPNDLARLGKAANPTITDERSALRHGAGQFKVNFDQLRREFGESGWARSNIIVAVAGSGTDGTSGVSGDQEATLRQEVEKFAHAIFASSSAQRDFWRGAGAATLKHLWDRYGGPKPCLHGVRLPRLGWRGSTR